MKVLKFCRMMSRRGHRVFHYGNAASQVDAFEHIPVNDERDLRMDYGDDLHAYSKKTFSFKYTDQCYRRFYKDTIKALESRIQERDLVLAFWGPGHYPIYDFLKGVKKGIFIEPGIGYNNSFCSYRVFESHAIMNFTLGLENSVEKPYQKKPSYFDVVIPNYFDVDEFTFHEKRQDFFLFLGRIHPCKGIDIALKLQKRLGFKLVVAGQGSLPESTNVTCKGYVDIKQREILLSEAKGLLVFSDYIEPFGGVAVEAMMSGCPVICRDIGAFSEIVRDKITGFKCRTFEDMIFAIEHIDEIDPVKCREWAVSNFSLETVAHMYESYFSSILREQKKYYPLEYNGT